jgi:hypothetical protein
VKPETKFRQNRVIPFLKTLRNTAYLPIQQVAINGSPDFVLCIHGHFVALELKSEGGEASPLQKYILGWIEKSGGTSIVAHPKNWPDIAALLKKMDEEKVC